MPRSTAWSAWRSAPTTTWSSRSAGQPERVFSREQLLDALGVASEAGYERNIDSHIKSLRAKLRQVNERGEAIQTHRGLGYSYSPDHA